MTDPKKLEVLRLIGEIVLSKLTCLDSEERYPVCSADESDDKIKQLKQDIADLRKVRATLEDLFSH